MPDIAEICRNNRNETWLRNWYGWETGVARNSSRGIPRAPTRSFREGRTARGERQGGAAWAPPPAFPPVAKSQAAQGIGVVTAFEVRSYVVAGELPGFRLAAQKVKGESK